MDGRQVPIRRTKPTQPGEIVRVRGEGMPKYQFSSEHGDLLVKLNVEFPSSFDSEQADSKTLTTELKTFFLTR